MMDQGFGRICRYLIPHPKALPITGALPGLLWVACWNPAGAGGARQLTLLDACRRLTLADSAAVSGGWDLLLRNVSMLTRIARRPGGGSGTGTGTDEA